MLIKRMKPEFEFVDNRGGLIQLVHDGWKQVNVISSKAGCIRGGHYHCKNQEAFYIISGKLKLTAEYKNIEEYYFFEGGDMFMVEENRKHTFEFLKDSLLISLYSKGVEQENGDKDIFE